MGFWQSDKANPPEIYFILSKNCFKIPTLGVFLVVFCSGAFANIQMIPAKRRLLLVWDVLHLNKSLPKKLTLMDKRESSSKTSSQIKLLKMFC